MPDHDDSPAKRPTAVPTVGRRSRLVVVLAAACLGSVWLLHSAPLDEARVPAAYPTISAASVAAGVPDGSLFRQIDAAVADRLPVRGAIVRHTLIPLVDAGFSPNDLVFRSPGGEPFFSSDFTEACAIQPQLGGLDAQLRTLRTKLSATGATFLYAIAPDKSQIDRAQLGPLGPKLLICSDVNRAMFSRMAAAPDSPLFVDFDALQAKAESGDRQYIEGDTHWNPRGAQTFAHDLLLRLEQEGVAPAGTADGGTIIDYGSLPRDDDLYRLMGAPRNKPIDLNYSTLPGVTTTFQTQTIDGLAVNRWRSTSTSAPLITGRTLLIGDSFVDNEAAYLVHDFADLTSVPFGLLDHPGDLIAQGGYDHIIVQRLQRQVPFGLDQVSSLPWITGPGAPTP